MEAASHIRTTPGSAIAPAGSESSFITAQRDFSGNTISDNAILESMKIVLEKGTQEEKKVISERLEVEIYNPELSIDFRRDLTKIRDEFSGTTCGARAQFGWDLEMAQKCLNVHNHQEQTRCYSEAQKPFSNNENSNNLIRENIQAVFKNGTPEQKEAIFKRLQNDIGGDKLPSDLKTGLVNIRDTFLGLDELKNKMQTWTASNQIKSKIKLVEALEYAWGGGFNVDSFGISACKQKMLANFPQTSESKKIAVIAFNTIVQNMLRDQLSVADKENFNQCLSGKHGKQLSYEQKKEAAQSWCRTRRDELYRIQRSNSVSEPEKETCITM